MSNPHADKRTNLRIAMSFAISVAVGVFAIDAQYAHAAEINSFQFVTIDWDNDANVDVLDYNQSMHDCYTTMKTWMNEHPEYADNGVVPACIPNEVEF